MSRLILFNKPYAVLCQFSAVEGRRTLKDYIPVPGVYPAGRLDAESEGLVALTDDGKLQARIADPRDKLAKTYWVQVEGAPDLEALRQLREGTDLGDYVTRRCEAKAIPAPQNLWPRMPPIRFRRNIPATWIEMVLVEGKNRQIRRMTARIGHPTLRLIRFAIGPWNIGTLAPGQWGLADAGMLVGSH